MFFEVNCSEAINFKSTFLGAPDDVQVAGIIPGREPCFFISTHKFVAYAMDSVANPLDINPHPAGRMGDDRYMFGAVRNGEEHPGTLQVRLTVQVIRNALLNAQLGQQGAGSHPFGQTIRVALERDVGVLTQTVEAFQ